MRLFLLLFYSGLLSGSYGGLVAQAIAKEPVPSIPREAKDSSAAAASPALLKGGAGSREVNRSAGELAGEAELASPALPEGGGREIADQRIDLFFLILQILRLQK